jgi:ribosomal protein S14
VLATVLSILGAATILAGLSLTFSQDVIPGIPMMFFGLILYFVSMEIGKKLNARALKHKIKNNYFFCERLAETSPQLRELCLQLNESYRNNTLKKSVVPEETYFENTSERCIYCGQVKDELNADGLCRSCFSKIYSH